MIKRFILMASLLIIAGSTWLLNQRSASAQGGNLLTNGSFEEPYYGQGSPTRTVPNGWTLVVSGGQPDAFPHNDRVQVIDGSVSWNIKQGYAVFTVAAYQQVSGFNAGDGLTFSANGWVYTCNNTATSCVIPDPPYRRSDTAAGAQLRVGIDPTGGTDPNSGNIKWSAQTAPYDQWAEMSASANAQGGTVTVFIFMTQTAGLAINNVYWDKASLVRTEIAPNATPTLDAVPFVVPQGVRPDGSIAHVVQANDTLFSIAFAYQDYGVTNESIAALNDMNPRSRFLQIGQELLILPAGSVDPATGQRLQQGQRVASPTQTPAPTLPAVADEPTPVADAGLPGAEDTPEPLPNADEATTAANYTTARAAFTPFERGVILWTESGGQVIVLVNGATDQEGASSSYIDTWREGMPESDPSMTPPDGLTQPTRNIGQAWRNIPAVQDAVGWATSATIEYTALIVQDGDTLVISAPDGRVYEILNKTWAATDLVPAE